ncbi:MAG: dihydroorotase [Lachnospiraceae bacterium]|nr:dihydroorotase [Lachnospiraceae bacterium]
MRLLVKNGHVLDPATGRNGNFDILVEDGKIRRVAPDIVVRVEKVLDAGGCYVMPGLIDMHVHLREPGFEKKETIFTGSRAAAKGGFTTVCAMPNTKPVTDNPYAVSDIVRQAERESIVHVLPVGAMTVGQRGEQVTDIEGMKAEGIVGVSEDGKSVMNADVCRQAMIRAAKADVLVMDHCEDKNLAGKGVLNAGARAIALEVEGISNAVEDVIVARDILLAKETGARLHLCHCSTKDSVLLTYLARQEGLPVTAEVCPHHFTLCDMDIQSADTNYKMNPPLRSPEDVEALKEGLKSGIIDVIATDHAPHTQEEKNLPLSEAPFGIVGLETALSLTWTELVLTGYLTPMEMVEKMSWNPAQILGIKKGTLKEGQMADITVFDPSIVYTIDKSKFASKGRNTPFDGREVQGQVRATVVKGKVVYFAK